MKSVIQVWFCTGAGENGKKLMPKIFLSFHKRISSMDVFIIWQFLEVYAPPQAIFRRKEREENSNITGNASRSGNLTIIIKLSADTKLTVFLRLPPLSKAAVRSLTATFPKIAPPPDS